MSYGHRDRKLAQKRAIWYAYREKQKAEAEEIIAAAKRDGIQYRESKLLAVTVRRILEARKAERDEKHE